jgi:hypothetical protein
MLRARLRVGAVFREQRGKAGRRREHGLNIRPRRALQDQAQEAVGGTAEQYATLAREDSDKFARLVKELDIKVE